jgi:hypothetical protein
MFERLNTNSTEAIERFLAEDLEVADRESLIDGSVTAGVLPAAAPPRGVYEEIVNVGMLSRLGDGELQVALS